MFEIGSKHFHSVCQHERALKLTGGNAAMEILPALVVLLTPADDELFLLDRDLELFARETRDRQRDTQAFGIRLVAAEPFDVVRGIAVRAFGDPIERTLDLVESDQERTGQ